MKVLRSSLVVPHDRLPTKTVLLTGTAAAVGDRDAHHGRIVGERTGQEGVRRRRRGWKERAGTQYEVKEEKSSAWHRGVSRSWLRLLLFAAAAAAAVEVLLGFSHQVTYYTL